MNIEDFCEDKAKKGEGQFAIAHAIYQLANAQKKLASEVQMLGAGTLHERGAVYEVAASLKDVAQSLELLNISANVTTNNA